jgi:histidinol-phosphate aminotransferase
VSLADSPGGEDTGEMNHMVCPKPHLIEIHRSTGHTVSRRNFLRLDMNESVEGLPEHFVQEILSSVRPEDLSSYPEYEELEEMLAENEGMALENILITNGSDAAIKHLFDAYIDVDDVVLMTDPTFAMYPVYSQISQARKISIPYKQDLSFPFDAFLKALQSHKPRMAVVVNPNNPTGSCLDPEKIQLLAEICCRQDTLFVVDEAYYHYLDETAVTLVRKFDNIVVLRTFSKLCGMAGLRLGYAVAPDSIISAMQKIIPTFDVNCLAVKLAKALLNRPDILKNQLLTIDEGKKWLIYRLEEKKIPYISGYSNFVLIDCGENSSLVAGFLKKNGILVGAGFKQSFLQNYIRVTLAGPKSMGIFWASISHFFD